VHAKNKIATKKNGNIQRSIYQGMYDTI